MTLCLFIDKRQSTLVYSEKNRLSPQLFLVLVRQFSFVNELFKPLNVNYLNREKKTENIQLVYRICGQTTTFPMFFFPRIARVVQFSNEMDFQFVNAKCSLLIFSLVSHCASTLCSVFQTAT